MTDRDDRDGWADGPRAEARALALEASRDAGPRRRKLLAQAYALDPRCPEALLLSGDDAPSPRAAADLYRQAADTSEQRLDCPGPGAGQQRGPGGPRLANIVGGSPTSGAASGRFGPGGHLAGHLWAHLEARCYIRSLCRLTHCLCELGLPREAARLGQKLLRLDQDDHVGVRFALLGCWLQLAEFRQAAELLMRFDQESSTLWAYGAALCRFASEGESQEALELLRSAVHGCDETAEILLRSDADENDTTHLDDERAGMDRGPVDAELLMMQRAWQQLPGARPWLASIVAEEPRESDRELTLAGPGAGASPHRERPALPEAASEVLHTLRDELEHRGDATILKQAEALWVGFFRSQEPTIRKAAVFAGAVDYLARFEMGQEISQAEAARRYGVHVSSISRAVSLLDHYLYALSPRDDLEDCLLADFADALAESITDRVVLPLDEDSIAELRSLPQTDEVWFGACRRAPFQVLEPTPHRPTIALWYQHQDGLIVGQEVYGPTVPPHALFHSLIQAIFAPVDGAPRRPARVRIEDSALADELRPVLGPLGIEVDNAPLEGIDHLMASLERFVARQGNQSYLEGGAEPALVARFFAAAASLRRCAPWNYVAEGQVISVDIADGQERRQVCVSVIGAGDLDQGLLIFRELDDYLQYFRHATLSELEGAVVGAPVELLSLVFEAGAELQLGQRREVFKYGWEVVGAEDYPLLLRVDPEGTQGSLTIEDYHLATACAEAISAYCAKHQGCFCGRYTGPQQERIALSHCDTLSEVCVSLPNLRDHR